MEREAFIQFLLRIHAGFNDTCGCCSDYPFMEAKKEVREKLIELGALPKPTES